MKAKSDVDTGGAYSRLIMMGMPIPESIYANKKAQENRRRMTETPVPFLILSMSVSTVVTMLTATTYNIVATYFVSGLGSSAVAAVGLMFSVTALVQAVGYMFGMGAGSEIARLLGQGKKTAAEQTLASGLFGGIVSGAFMATVFMVFREPVCRLLGATDTSLPFAMSYGSYVMAAAPVMCGAYVMNNALRAEGQPYLALAGVAAGGVTNAFLNYILVWRFDLGISGAGISLLAGQSVSLVIMLVCAHTRRSVLGLSLRRMTKPVGMCKIARVGSPSLLRQGLMCVAAVMTSRSLTGYGDDALAGVTVANKVFAVIFAALVGYGQGFAPVAGFACGAKQPERARRALNFTMLTSVLAMTAVALCTYVWADGITGLFLGDDAGTASADVGAAFEPVGISAYASVAASVESASEISALALRAHALSMPFVAVCLVMGMYYQALGSYGKAAFISALRQGVFFIPVIYVLPRIFELAGVAWSQPAADVLSGLVAGGFYISRKKLVR